MPIEISGYRHSGVEKNCSLVKGNKEGHNLRWSLNGYMEIYFCPFCGEELVEPTLKGN